MNPWLSDGLHFSGRLFNMFQIRMITCANFPECKFHRVVQKMRRYSLLFMSQKIKSRWKIACIGSYTTHTIYIYHSLINFHDKTETFERSPSRLEWLDFLLCKFGIFIPGSKIVPSIEVVSSFLLNKVNLFQTLFLLSSLRIYLLHKSKSSYSVKCWFFWSRSIIQCFVKE